MVSFIAISSLSNVTNFHCHVLSSTSSSSLQVPSTLVQVVFIDVSCVDACCKPSLGNFHALMSLQGRLPSLPSLHWCDQATFHHCHGLLHCHLFIKQCCQLSLPCTVITVLFFITSAIDSCTSCLHQCLLCWCMLWTFTRPLSCTAVITGLVVFFAISSLMWSSNLPSLSWSPSLPSPHWAMSPTFIAMCCHQHPLHHYKCHRLLCKLSSSMSLVLMHAANLPLATFMHWCHCRASCLLCHLFIDVIKQPSITVMVYFIAISSSSNVASFHCHALSSLSSSSFPCALVITMHGRREREEWDNHSVLTLLDQFS